MFCHLVLFPDVVEAPHVVRQEALQHHHGLLHVLQHAHHHEVPLEDGDGGGEGGGVGQGAAGGRGAAEPRDLGVRPVQPLVARDHALQQAAGITLCGVVRQKRQKYFLAVKNIN